MQRRARGDVALQRQWHEPGGQRVRLPLLQRRWHHRIPVGAAALQRRWWPERQEARMITLDVPVPNVAAAVAFYVRAFGVEPAPPDATGACALVWGSVVLRVCDEATHVPDDSDRIYYDKGRTPRLEMRVDDVDAAVECAAAAGARSFPRSPSSDGSPGHIYAQVLDPFGHLWSFKREGYSAPR